MIARIGRLFSCAAVVLADHALDIHSAGKEIGVSKPLKGGGMFKSIRLRNFKCYRDSGVIPFAPLTVIIGCNNTGKSTILQSILALSQTLDGPAGEPFVTKGRHVDLGGFYDIVHGKGISSGKHFSIEVQRTPERVMQVDPGDRTYRESTGIALTFGFSRKANKIEVRELELSDAEGAFFRCSESRSSWSLKDFPTKYRKHIQVGLRHFLPVSRLSDGEKLLKLLNSPRAAAELRKVPSAGYRIDMQGHPWWHIFSDISRIPPHRSHVPFYTGMGERIASDSGKGGSVLQVLAGTEKVGKTDRTLLKLVSKWMTEVKALSKLSLEKLDPERRIVSLIADDPAGHSAVNVAAMGEGISQLLPIAASTLGSPVHQSIIVEQPEIHLHPRLQSDLADLFIDVVKSGNRQVIIETHSEHLLLRLRRRIAEGKTISNDKVSILFVSKEDGESKVTPLAMDGNGHFDAWPDGFFDQTYQEAMALAMAQPQMRNSNARRRSNSRHANNGNRVRKK